MSEMVNPYIAGAPVTEGRMFFGREDVFDWIQNNLTGRYTDHTLVIHGQRRVGKTSVLKQLGNRLNDKYIPVFFDLQGRTHTTLGRFLWWLAMEILRVLKQERGIALPSPARELFSEDIEYFERQFLPSLRPVLGEMVLLLTFDEFDNLEESGIKEELAIPLIEYLRRLMGQEGLDFIFSIGSSGRKLENMQAAYTEFFKTALYKKISFLSREQAFNLVTWPVEGLLEYETQSVDRIFEITSGHPYFTQLICHELFSVCQQSGELTIREKDVEAVLDDVVERGTVNLKFVWDEASEVEKWILAFLAQSEGKKDTPALFDFMHRQRLRHGEPEINSSLLHLRDKDILTVDNRFVNYLLKLWLKKNRSLDQVRDELTKVNPRLNNYIQVGLDFQERGQFEKAIGNFREALVVDPGHVPAQVCVAQAYMAQQAYGQAVMEYEKALGMDDQDVSARAGLCEAHLALGDAALAKGKTKEAITSYQKVLGINGEHTEARQRMAEILRQKAVKALAEGRDEEGLTSFSEALKYTPEDAALAARFEQARQERKAKVLGSLLARADKEQAARNWAAAVETVKYALELDPASETASKKMEQIQVAQHQDMLASIMERVERATLTSRWGLVIAGLEEYLRLEPDNAQMKSRLDEAHVRQRQAQLENFRQRLDALARQEKYPEALTLLQEAAQEFPEEAGNLQVEKEKLEKLQGLGQGYAEAQQAMTARHYDHAVSLLIGIINQDVNYKDASRLLAQAIEMRRASRPKLDLKKLVKPAMIGFGVIVFGLLMYFGWNLVGKNPALLNLLPNRQTTVTPTAETVPQAVSSFFSPSIAEMISEAPDFQDDFSAPNADWYPLADGINEASLIFDGSLVMGIQAGTPAEKLLLQSTKMTANNFAVAFDFYYEDSSGGLTLGIGFPSSGKDAETYAGVDLEPEKQTWSMLLTDGTFLSSHAITKPLKGQWSHIQVIYYEGKMAALLDGEISLHAEGIEHSTKDIWIYAQGGRGKVLFDNVKFWDLGFPSSPPTQAVAPPILTYLEENAPDFQDDFSKPNPDWTPMAENETVSDHLTNGYLLLDVQPGASTEKYVLSAKEWNANFFALDYDFYYETATGGTYSGAGFPHTGNGDGTNADLHFDPDGQSWYMGLLPGTNQINSQTDSTMVGEWTHVRLIYANETMAAFANGKYLGSLDGIQHSASVTWIYATGGTAKIRFDNVKFWNLDGVSASLSQIVTPPPTATASGAVSNGGEKLSWTRLNSLQDLPADSVSILLTDPNDPGIMYAATQDSGIYKSIDGGGTWQPINDGLGRAVVDSLVMDYYDRRVLYAGTVLGGVYKTYNGGASWKAMNNGINIQEIGWISLLAIDPNDRYHLYYTDGKNVYETINGGQPWEVLKKSGPGCPAFTSSLVVDPLDGKGFYVVDEGDGGRNCQPGLYMYKRAPENTWNRSSLKLKNDEIIKPYHLWIEPTRGMTLYTSTESSLWISYDQGQNWTQNNNLRCDAMAFDPQDAETAYCAGDQVWKSVDDGKTWESISDQGKAISLAVSPVDQKTLFIGGGFGISKSEDGGKTWKETANGLGHIRFDLSIKPDNGDLYANDFFGNFFRSSDHGNTWEFLKDQNPVAGTSLAFGSDGITLWKVNGNTLYKSGDGETWDKFNLPQEVANKAENVAAHPVNPGWVFLSGSGNEPPYIYYSKDAGATWQPAVSNFSVNTNQLMLFFDHEQGNLVYGLDSGGDFFRSKDGGLTWNVMLSNPGYYNSLSDTRLAIDPADPNHIYLATRGAGIRMSTDAGNTWVWVNVGLGNLFINSLAIDPNNPSTIYAGTDNGVYVSFDKGDNWGEVNNGLLESTIVYSIVVDNHGNVFAGTPFGIFQLQGK